MIRHALATLAPLSAAAPALAHELVAPHVHSDMPVGLAIGPMIGPMIGLAMIGLATIIAADLVARVSR